MRINPAVADTGKLTRAVGGAIVTGLSVTMVTSLIGLMIWLKRDKKA